MTNRLQTLRAIVPTDRRCSFLTENLVKGFVAFILGLVSPNWALGTSACQTVFYASDGTRPQTHDQAWSDLYSQARSGSGAHPLKIAWVNGAHVFPKRRLDPRAPYDPKNSYTNQFWPDGPFVRSEEDFVTGERSLVALSPDFDFLVGSELIEAEFKGLFPPEKISGLFAGDHGKILVSPERVYVGAVLDPKAMHQGVATIRIYRGTYGSLQSSMPMFETIVADTLSLLPKDRSLYDMSLGFVETLKSWAHFQSAEFQNRPPDTPKQSFEIGRLALSKLLQFSVEIRGRAMTLLDLFFYKHFLLRFPEGEFWAYVKTPEHAALFRRGYGMREYESFIHPMTGKQEFILFATGAEMAEVVRKRYKIPLSQASSSR